MWRHNPTAMSATVGAGAVSQAYGRGSLRDRPTGVAGRAEVTGAPRRRGPRTWPRKCLAPEQLGSRAVRPDGGVYALAHAGQLGPRERVGTKMEGW